MIKIKFVKLFVVAFLFSIPLAIEAYVFFTGSNGNVSAKTINIGADLQIATGSAIMAASFDDIANPTTYKLIPAGTSKLNGLVTAGNVGIGTTGPGALLDVSGTSAGASLTSAILQTTSSTANSSSRLILRNAVATGTTSNGNDILWQGASSANLGQLVVNNNGSGGSNMVFGTRTNAGSLTDKVTIDNAGNVGIGTTNPGALLDVSGSVSMNGFLATRISEVNNTKRKIICSSSAGQYQYGDGGSYLISMGYSDTTTPYATRFATYILVLGKHNNSSWDYSFTSLGTSSFPPGVTMTVTTNGSTQLTLTFTVTAPAGHTHGNYTVLQIGGAQNEATPTWSIADN